ncbi:MAG: O-succinylhomoserine sulfhydrylase [Phenylobacterium sp.]|uniref:O-succinylhomoserine sulfhydrylase n=1 Tax=Phenylobacterium sp. TaxID=1871053 RepID=UPI002723F9C8|nr:O-succinylhomoserine sulfhydrylase [Phenylobacterium sp.]MDO8913400.1 O-succinylhomoserine sulfhydrylase [Phenylobacterium sp.]MDP2009087.1 O-succinylhomoserine sulfhydrylase [Phenylobacterium sp.]MDP3101246.1 O-succinylhomoserine sulfhydrylase [Phenylobacterium sp.]MDP3632518.1 O-succinylhomoserine sulfhydrylase [Phenylobacterium sp.]MDP3867783.1 O-succinylhomoserine sulfhydrylase [Phenylobacterium sp.]
MAEDPNTWQQETKLVRGGMARSPYGEISEALFLTQSFSYESASAADKRFSGEEPGFIYQRFGNPTTQMFEDRLALLEGAEQCRATASGMAAVHVALQGLVRAGDHIVAGRALFGSCRWILSELMPRYGVEVTFVDATDIEAWKNAVRPNTKAFLVETPANPLLEVTAIGAVADVAHAAGAKLVVDNVFATPLFQKPLALGADIVVYSATKHIDGQGRVLGGAILGGAELMTESYKDLLRHTGPALSPFNSWVLVKALETLELRVTRQTQNAAKVADAIGAHAKCRRVIYPGRPDHPQAAIIANQMSGGGSVVAFDLGSREAAWRFLDTLAIVDISNNLGDAKSMATHPSTTTHRSMPEAERLSIGLTEGWVRMSVGLEGSGDLIRDVERALDAA